MRTGNHGESLCMLQGPLVFALPCIPAPFCLLSEGWRPVLWGDDSSKSPSVVPLGDKSVQIQHPYLNCLGLSLFLF